MYCLTIRRTCLTVRDGRTMVGVFAQCVEQFASRIAQANMILMADDTLFIDAISSAIVKAP